MGVLGPIPWESIDRFARQNGYDPDDVEYDLFIYVIQKLDEVFLEHQRAEQEREKAKLGNTGSFRPANASARRGHPRKRR